MPFTPFHFGPSACVSLPMGRHLDVPVFILANVAIDLEPLSVTVFDLAYPYHGYCHTFVVGTLVGIAWALVAFSGRRLLTRLMAWLRLGYDTSLRKMLVSAVLGVWFHVLLDAPLYRDIRPFWPIAANPLYAVVSPRAVYGFCAVSFIPALALYTTCTIAFRRARAGPT